MRTWRQFFEKVLPHLFASSPSKRVEACCHLDIDLTLWPRGPHKMPSIGAWHGMQLKDLFVVLFLLQGLQEFILAVFRLCTLHGTNISHLGKRKRIFKSALVGDTECEYLFVRTLPSQIHCWWLPTSSIMWFIGFSTFQSPSAFCMETQLVFLGRGFQTPGCTVPCWSRKLSCVQRHREVAWLSVNVKEMLSKLSSLQGGGHQPFTNRLMFCLYLGFST